MSPARNSTVSAFAPTERATAPTIKPLADVRAFNSDFSCEEEVESRIIAYLRKKLLIDDEMDIFISDGRNVSQIHMEVYSDGQLVWSDDVDFEKDVPLDPSGEELPGDEFHILGDGHQDGEDFEFPDDPDPVKNAASAFGGQPNVLSMTQTSDAGQPFAMKGCCTFYAKSMAEVYAHHADNDHDTVQGLTMAWFKFSAEIVGSEIRVTHVELPEGKLADLVLLAKHPFSVQGESYLDITPRNAPEIRSANKGRLRECCKRIAEDFLETRDAFDEQPPSENRKAKAAATSGWGKKKRERGLVIAPRGAK